MVKTTGRGKITGEGGGRQFIGRALPSKYGGHGLLVTGH
jgi:hypothetical protein